ncbi:hypothetical protein DNTS_004004, partial [Danionella cerebrum]
AFVPSSKMFRVKIVLIGPSECGKTTLANFLSDTTESIGGDYNPTQGVRILEFDSQNVPSGNKSSVCEVELWDCAGDFKMESCWPALMKDSNGVVIVFNPDVPNHVKEIETWHSAFISSQMLLESQCLLIAHHKPGRTDDNAHISLGMYSSTYIITMSQQLNKIPLIHSNLEEDPEDLRQGFNKYLATVVRMLSENQEREEMSIIT